MQLDLKILGTSWIQLHQLHSPLTWVNHIGILDHYSFTKNSWSYIMHYINGKWYTIWLDFQIQEYCGLWLEMNDGAWERGISHNSPFFTCKKMFTIYPCVQCTWQY